MSDNEYVGVGLKHNGEYILKKFTLPDNRENNLDEAQWYFLWYVCPSFCEDSLVLRFEDVLTLLL